MNFFSFNFPLREYIFFVLRPPPPISFLMVRPLASAYMKNVDPFVLANGACACSDCLPLTELSHSCPPPQLDSRPRGQKKRLALGTRMELARQGGVTLPQTTCLEEWPGQTGRPSSRAGAELTFFSANVNSLPRFVTKCVWKDGSSIVAWVWRVNDPPTTEVQPPPFPPW